MAGAKSLGTSAEITNKSNQPNPAFAFIAALTWEKVRLVSEPEKHMDLGGLVSYTTADERDKDGKIHEDVTIIPPDKK